MKCKDCPKRGELSRIVKPTDEQKHLIQAIRLGGDKPECYCEVAGGFVPRKGGSLCVFATQAGA